MTPHSTKESLPPMPEPWQALNDLAFWLDGVGAHAGSGNPESENAEMRDALRTATGDLLNIVRSYRTDREHSADLNKRLVSRYTAMMRREDGTAISHGVFATEQEAEESAARLKNEAAGITATWVRRFLVPVALERVNKAMERFLTETGLTEDELADAVARHPA